MDEHFSIHLKKPLLETRQKLVSMNKIILLKRTLDLSVIYKVIKQNEKHTCIKQSNEFKVLQCKLCDMLRSMIKLI